MTDAAFPLDPATTALVLIDLQKGILPLAKAPHDAATVMANAVALAQAFRAAGALVVRVRVGFAPDFADRLNPPVDSPSPPGALPADWMDDPDDLPAHPADVAIQKRQWGAFYGTDLDLQMRRRGIRTLVVGGISTPFGVESTARDAWERGYALVLPEDLSSAATPGPHRDAFDAIFPRIARIRTSAQVIAALKAQDPRS